MTSINIENIVGIKDWVVIIAVIRYENAMRCWGKSSYHQPHKDEYTCEMTGAPFIQGFFF